MFKEVHKSSTSSSGLEEALSMVSQAKMLMPISKPSLRWLREQTRKYLSYKKWPDLKYQVRPWPGQPAAGHAAPVGMLIMEY